MEKQLDKNLIVEQQSHKPLNVNTQSPQKKPSTKSPKIDSGKKKHKTSRKFMRRSDSFFHSENEEYKLHYTEDVNLDEIFLSDDEFIDNGSLGSNELSFQGTSYSRPQITDYVQESAAVIKQKIKSGFYTIEEGSKRIKETLMEKQQNFRTKITAQNAAIKDSIRSNLKPIKKKINRGVHREVQKFMIKTEDESFHINIDKYSYTIAVIGMIITSSLLFHPRLNYLVTWINLVNMSLIVYRFVLYKSRKEHYYFFDYCYYMNLINIFVQAFFPQNLSLQLVCFQHFGGPVVNALLYMGSKLIFHDFDTLCTFSMHFLPFCQYWILRYHHEDPNLHLPNSKEWDLFIDSLSFQDTVNYFLLAIQVYLIWNIGYYFIIFVFLKDRIQRRGYWTLFQYLMSEQGAYGTMTMAFGNLAPIIYLCGHGAFSLACFGISQLHLKYYYVCQLGVMIYVLVPVYRGSVYYFNYFTKSYDNKIKKKVEMAKERRASHLNNVSWDAVSQDHINRLEEE